MRWITFWLSIVFLASRCAWGADAEPAENAVVIVSVDGLAAFYWDDPRAEMPTIRALAKEGASATSMTTVAPTVTWPNHTTLITGVTPARHGVVGNDYYDRAHRRPVPLMTDPEGLKERLVRVPTLYDLAKARGLTTAAIRWPATRGAKNLDWTLPDVFSDELLHEYSTPELMKECKAAGVWADGEVVQAGTRELRVVSDDACTRVFNFILERHRPGLSLLHVTFVDHEEHVKGPRTPDAYTAIKLADEQVRSVWETTKRVYGDKATLIVLSDHGFSPVERLVMPNVVLHEAGLIETNGDQVTGGTVHVTVQGGAALVYILDAQHRADVLARSKALFSSLEGVAKVVESSQLTHHGLAEPQTDPRSPDILLFAKEGWSFGSSTTGAVTTIAPADRKGAHGHDEHLPIMDATFVAWGRGIKSGARLGRIANIDVAPTVARLLGLPLEGADGKPLTAALSE
jgi:predicted AlkP superfamily pyrophosphatase or phosphodiesterase